MKTVIKLLATKIDSLKEKGDCGFAVYVDGIENLIEDYSKSNCIGVFDVDDQLPKKTRRLIRDALVNRINGDG